MELDEDIFSSDSSHGDKAYDAFAEYSSSKKRRERMSSSEEEAFSAVIKPKRVKVSVPATSEGGTGIDESLDVSSAEDENQVSGMVSQSESRELSQEEQNEPPNTSCGLQDPISAEEIERIAHSLQGLSGKELMQRGIIEPSRREKIRNELLDFERVPTTVEIKKTFKEKRKFLEMEVERLQKKEKACLVVAKDFWTAVREEQGMKLRELGTRSRARPRKSTGTRKRTQCPLWGCSGKTVNITKHLSQCHKHLSSKEQVRIIDIQRKLIKKKVSGDVPEKKKIPKERYPLRRCPACEKSVKRLDVHLVKVHLLKRKSKQFRDFLKKSDEEMKGQTVKDVEVASGIVTVSTSDSKKKFFDGFKKYLHTDIHLADYSVTSHVQRVNEVINYAKGDSQDVLKGSIICKFFNEMTEKDQPGYLTAKKKIFSYAYMRKIILACKRAVMYMASLPENDDYKITEEEKGTTEKCLLAMSIGYQKKEKIEQMQVRNKKVKRNVTLDVIQNIYKSPYITETLQTAERCLDDAELRPWTVTDFTRLRDVLLTALLITSLRRPLEFIEFRLSEFIEAEVRKHQDRDDIDCYVIRIAQHKTAEEEPSLLFVKENEYRALSAYVKYYRPIACSCASPECHVFPNRENSTTNECCSKLSFSNFSRIVRKVIKESASEVGITSGILRHSQITALWERSDNPAWQEKVATQCGHSLDTARRYFGFNEKVNTGKKVVDTLRKLRKNIKTNSQPSTSATDPDDISASTSSVLGGKEAEEVLEEGVVDNDLAEVPEEEVSDPDATSASTSTVLGGKEAEEVLEEGVVDNDLADVSEEEVSGGASLGDDASETDSDVVSVLNSNPSTSSVFPDDLSILSVASGCEQDASGLLPVKKPDTATMYKDIMRAISVTNLSRSCGPKVVCWKLVKAEMERKNPLYFHWTHAQIKDRYKYILKVKKRF